MVMFIETMIIDQLRRKNYWDIFVIGFHGDSQFVDHYQPQYKKDGIDTDSYDHQLTVTFETAQSHNFQPDPNGCV